MTGLYAVTAHPSTSVSRTLKGSLTAPDELNLVVCKSTSLDIYTVEPSGLRHVQEVPIYGRIATVELYRPQTSETDYMFVCTERYKFLVFSWSAARGGLVTEAMGDVKDRIGRPTDVGQIGLVDTRNRCLALHLYQGLLKIVPMYTPELASQTGAIEWNVYKATTAADIKGKTSGKIRNGELGLAFNVRLDELNILSMAFIQPPASPNPGTGNEKFPLLAVLYEDARSVRHLRTYWIHLGDKDLKDGPWSQMSVEPGSNLLVPIPALPEPHAGAPGAVGGCLVLGERTITWMDGPLFKTHNLAEPTIFKCWTVWDVEPQRIRMLLGDFLGKVWALELHLGGKGQVDTMGLHELGTTSTPTTLTHLDSGYVFVGSHYGDSQLIKLLDEPIPAPRDPASSLVPLRNGTDPMDLDLDADAEANLAAAGPTMTWIQEIERYTNLAPMIDFVCVDLEGQGQGQIVGCCNAYKDGSIRVIRNGVGIIESGALQDVVGVKGLWSVKTRAASGDFDDCLAIAFAEHTQYLVQNPADQSLEDWEATPLETAETTLSLSTTSSGAILQVTPSRVALFAPDGGVKAWTPDPADGVVTVASVSGDQCVVCFGSGLVVYLEAEPEPRELSRRKLEYEVSCINLTPLSSDAETALGRGRHQAGAPSRFVSVGCWTDAGIRVLSLPELNPVAKEPLDGEIIPRSTLMMTMEGVGYLFVGLGDGVLYVFRMDFATGSLSDKRKVTLATQPISLCRLERDGQSHVFAASDRPTVIYSSGQKLLFSNVNIPKEVTHMTTFHIPSDPYSIAYSNESGITFGSIDSIQKLHIRTIPLGGQMARRIAYQEETKTFGLLTTRVDVNSADEEEEINMFRVLDCQTYECPDDAEFRMGVCECVQSICSAQFEDDPLAYYVVGTAYAFADEEEPRKGRILVFRVDPTTKGLSLVAETECKGAVYQVLAFNGKLVAGINSKVELFQWQVPGDQPGALVPLCSHYGHILALYLAVRGDFIVVGDLMKSICLLKFNAATGTIEETARDYNTTWMTGCEILDDDTYIGAENAYNLFTVKRHSELVAEEDRRRLEVVGEWGLGEFVNRFRHGSLVMQTPDTQAPAQPTLLFATINGMVGVIATLSDEKFALLDKLQKNLRRVVRGVGGLDHEEWRSFVNERRTAPPRGFIDGDLIERFLDLSAEDKQTVAHGPGGAAGAAREESAGGAKDKGKGKAPARDKGKGKAQAPAGGLSGDGAGPADEGEWEKLGEDVEALTKLVEDLSRIH